MEAAQDHRRSHRGERQAAEDDERRQEPGRDTVNDQRPGILRKFNPLLSCDNGKADRDAILTLFGIGR
ncbi:MAG: hypothetical protein ACLQGV_01240 [Bryobacteraceae bacterium]